MALVSCCSETMTMTMTSITVMTTIGIVMVINTKILIIVATIVIAIFATIFSIKLLLLNHYYYSYDCHCLCYQLLGSGAIGANLGSRAGGFADLLFEVSGLGLELLGLAGLCALNASIAETLNPKLCLELRLLGDGSI